MAHRSGAPGFAGLIRRTRHLPRSPHETRDTAHEPPVQRTTPGRAATHRVGRDSAITGNTDTARVGTRNVTLSVEICCAGDGVTRAALLCGFG